MIGRLATDSIFSTQLFAQKGYFATEGESLIKVLVEVIPR